MPNTQLIFDSDKKSAPVSGGKKRGKALLPAAAGFVAVAAAGLVWLIAPKNSSEAYVLKLWNEAAVTTATIRNTVSSTGTIELKDKETELAPETSQVSAVYVSEGDTVTKGQAIAQLVTADLDWELVVAQAALDEILRDAAMTDTQFGFTARQQNIAIKTAERNLQTAQDTLEQTQGLFERGIASQSELTAAKNSVADANDSLELAKLTQEQSQAQHAMDLSNRANTIEQKQKAINDLKESIAACTIRSGVNGRVYSLSIAVGDRISEYSSVAVIADPADLQVGIDVAENRIGEVKLGDGVAITIGDTVAKGMVTAISSSATASSSSSTSTVRVVSDFTAVPSNAIVGGSVSTEIEVGVIENALTLPRGPYLSSGNYSAVYVIDGNKAAKKTASFGITDGNTIQVLSGLSEGDAVITSAYQEYIHLGEISLSK